MDTKFIRELADKLVEYQYTYLKEYIQKLTSNQLNNFVIWLESQLPEEITGVNNLSEKQIELIKTILSNQERYMSKANWNWLSTSEETYTYTLDKNGNFVKTKKSIFSSILTLMYMNIVAFCVLFAGFAYIFAVTFWSNTINDSNLRFIDQSLGNIYGIINTIVGFYFGGAFNSLTTDKPPDSRH